jgi:hypothetical protein
MAIPVTTVASKSVFSTGGRVISRHRSRLAPKIVEGLMCMQAWSRADMLGNQSCFMNALLICSEEEEEKVTSFTLFYLIMCYYYYHYSLFLFDYLNKYSLFFIDRIILILPSLIEKNGKYYIHNQVTSTSVF